MEAELDRVVGKKLELSDLHPLMVLMPAAQLKYKNEREFHKIC